jgi:hypothetical protein
MSSAEQAEALIRSRLSGEQADAVVTALRPAAWLRNLPIDSDADTPTGASKLGGAPDPPPGVAWPAARTTRHFERAEALQQCF